MTCFKVIFRVIHVRATTKLDTFLFKLIIKIPKIIINIFDDLLETNCFPLHSGLTVSSVPQFATPLALIKVEAGAERLTLRLTKGDFQRKRKYFNRVSPLSLPFFLFLVVPKEAVHVCPTAAVVVRFANVVPV